MKKLARNQSIWFFLLVFVFYQSCITSCVTIPQTPSKPNNIIPEVDGKTELIKDQYGTRVRVVDFPIPALQKPDHPPMLYR
jgi:hypothetical protein